MFFSSFDNDNKHNNPYIMAMTNDGTQAYDHQKDGMTQQLAGCLRDFRNKPFPVKAKIQYYMNTLTVGKSDVIIFSSTFEEPLYILSSLYGLCTGEFNRLVQSTKHQPNLWNFPV